MSAVAASAASVDGPSAGSSMSLLAIPSSAVHAAAHLASNDSHHLSASAPSSRASSLAGDELLTPPPSSPKPRQAVLYDVDHAFDPHQHWYPRALNAQLHPMVETFLSLGNVRIVERFCHLNPAVHKAQLTALLTSRSRVFRWSGADLFNVTNSRGKRQMIVVETNSCPSGQKSMPIQSLEQDNDGYHQLIRSTFQQLMKEAEAKEPLVQGALAVIFDKVSTAAAQPHSRQHATPQPRVLR